MTALSKGAIVLALFSAAMAHGQADNKKEIVKGTKTITGKLVGFEQGDYIHAIIKDSKGETVDFFLGGDPGIEFFLAINANKKGSFKIQTIDAWIEEAGSRMTIERLVSAKFGAQTSSAWWKAQRKKMSPEAISNKYYPKVEKLMKNNAG